MLNTGGVWGYSDFGERVVVPFLNKKGVPKLQNVIITDLVGNLQSLNSIQKEIEIKKLFLADTIGLDVLQAELEAKEEIPEIQILNGSDSFFYKRKGMQIQLNSYISPPQEKLNLIEINNQKTRIVILQEDFHLLANLPKVIERIKGCDVLALPEGKIEILKKIISLVLPANVILTRPPDFTSKHLENLPQRFPLAKFYRAKTQGEIEVTFWKNKLKIKPFLKNKF
jgi:hypothetical protein